MTTADDMREEIAKLYERAGMFAEQADKLGDQLNEVERACENALAERDEAKKEIARLRGALTRLLLSRDASWAGGHDWSEAVDEAIRALGSEPEAA